MAITDLSYLAELRKRAIANNKLCMLTSTYNNVLNFSAVNISNDANTANWGSLVWSPKLKIFCCINASTSGGGTQTSMISADGLNWTIHSNLSNLYNWADMIWSSELEIFCAIGSRTVGSTVECVSAVSSDGINWDLRIISNEANTLFSCITWSQKYNKFYALTSSSIAVVISSSDGLNWTRINVSALNNIAWRSIVWSKKLEIFCAVGILSNTSIAISPNGVTWTITASSATVFPRSLTFAEDLGLFVAVGSGSSGAYISYDGINWSVQSLSQNEWQKVTYCPELNLFFAIANAGTNTQRISYSVNGVDWIVPTTLSSGDNYLFSGCEWAPELGILCISSSVGGNSSTKNRIFTNYTASVAFHYKKINGYL